MGAVRSRKGRVDAIHAYLIDQAWQGDKDQEKAKAPQ